MKTKLCSKCGVSKALTTQFFSLNAKLLSGFHSHCRECDRARARAWHLKNPAKRAALTRAWRAVNPDKNAAYSIAWVRANPERAAAAAKNGLKQTLQNV